MCVSLCVNKVYYRFVYVPFDIEEWECDVHVSTFKIYAVCLFFFFFFENKRTCSCSMSNQMKQASKQTGNMFSIKMIHFSNFPIAQLTFFNWTHFAYTYFLFALKSQKKISLFLLVDIITMNKIRVNFVNCITVLLYSI